MERADIELIARGQTLANDLRREGREADAEVLQTLLSLAERDVAPGRYLTTGQVAARLGVSRQTVVNWIKRGVIPGARLGGRLVVPNRVLERFAPIEKLLDELDNERLPLSGEEAAELVGSDREGWQWQDHDE
jgi:excisionase family DNA binding protein